MNTEQSMQTKIGSSKRVAVTAYFVGCPSGASPGRPRSNLDRRSEVRSDGGCHDLVRAGSVSGCFVT